MLIDVRLFNVLRHRLVVEADPAAVARTIWSRYGALADRIVLSPDPSGDALSNRILADLRTLASRQDAIPATPA